MKNKRIFIWVASAFLYLGVVVGGYSIYAALSDKSSVAHNDHEQHEDTEDDAAHEHNEETSEDNENHEDHEDHGEYSGESEVHTIFAYDGKVMELEFEDKEGNPVTELEINHEKLVHLIVVSNDLEDYYHFHPTEVEAGKFQFEYTLSDGNYRVFGDIKPIGYEYHAEPIPLLVGKDDSHAHTELLPDTDFTKEQDGITVTMKPEEFPVGTSITLDFVIEGAEPEKYLGALGHVVILDDHLDEYIHVHPTSYTETKFETKFSEPGLYKVWGEFQFNGTVYIYPFVIEVK